MKSLRFLLCKALLFASPLFLSGQSAGLVHLNQSFYVSGEAIWYKLYLPAGFPSGPKVIAVSLYGPGDRLVEQSHLQQRDPGSVFGYYKIPYEWTPGVYRLVFSAAEEATNRPVPLAAARIPIYSDFTEQNQAADVPAAGKTGAAAAAPDRETLRVQIHTDRENYGPRGAATLRITITDAAGQRVPAQLSIAVSDDELSRVDHPLFSTRHTGKPLGEFPELEEEVTLRGTLHKPDDSALLPSGNIGAYLVNQRQFLYAKADPQARFTLDLPPVHGPCPIHIGGFLPEDLLVKLDRTVDPAPAADPELPYPPEVLRYLEWSRQRKTIYQLYGRLENAFTASFPTSAPPWERADSPIALDEYSAFPDLPTLVKELLIPIRFRTARDGTYNARIFDPTLPDRRFHTKGPVFILDGRITRNDDYIARLDIKKIERFDLYFDFDKGLRLFGPMARNGLVMIQSRNRDLDVPPADQKNYFEIQGFQAEVQYPIQMEPSESQPVMLRPALFWAPGVRTNENGEATATVPLGDDHSRFRVEVVVQDEDGRRGFGEALFVVGGRK